MINFLVFGESFYRFFFASLLYFSTFNLIIIEKFPQDNKKVKKNLIKYEIYAQRIWN